MIRCICCPTKKPNDNVMERFDGIEDALYGLRKAIKDSKDDLTDDDDDSSSPRRAGEHSTSAASGFPYDSPERMKSESR